MTQTQQICMNKTTGKTYIITGQQNDIVCLAVDGKIKSIKLSTFKRHYRLLNEQMKVDEQLTEQMCEQQQKEYDRIVQHDQKQKEKVSKKINAKPWKYYYKPYAKNSLPLWDAVIEDGDLILKDVNKNIIMTCYMSKTKTCVIVKQQSTGCRRYFNNFRMVRKHILNNQDIRTINSVGKVFDKWLADATIVNKIIQV